MYSKPTAAIQIAKGFSLSCAALFAATLLQAGEFEKRWDYSNRSEFRFYAAKGCNALLESDTSIKSPDGGDVIKVVLNELRSEAAIQDVQVTYKGVGLLKSGNNYEISFYGKATQPGVFQLVVAHLNAPWTIIPGSVSSAELGQDWKLYKFTFKVTSDWPEPLAIPRLMFGKFGAPATLYLGPVTLREKTALLPYGLGIKWKLVFAGSGVDSAQESAYRVSGISASDKPKEVEFVGSGIDLAKLNPQFSAKDCAYLYNEFQSKSAGRMRFGFSADWWLELYLNGEKVYSNVPVGNNSHDFTIDDHVIEFPVRQGNNLLVAKVMSGTDGWRFVCGEARRAPDDNNVVTIRNGPNWKSVNLDKDKLAIKSGTALDFSSIAGERSIAGAKGRLTINSTGRLAFEKDLEKSVRLLGFNSWSCSWALHLATKEEIKQWAETIAKRGYNIVRFQGIDTMFAGGANSQSRWPSEDVEETPHFDEAVIDKFDYLLFCLKQNGIYINLDLMSAKSGYSRVNVSQDKSFKIQLFFNETYRKQWLKAVETLLTHKNPYTGVPLKDEPALACLEPYNEQDLLLFNAAQMQQLTPHFGQYLQKKYGTEEALRAAWKQNSISFRNVPVISEDVLRRGDASANDACQFLIQTMSATTDWYVTQLRKIGYPGIVTQWDMIMRTMEMPVRAKMPVIAQHSYFAHPNYAPTKGLVQKSTTGKIWGGGKDMDMLISQDSSINSSYFRAAAAVRFLDRPFMLTEYAHSAPNRYRHERGLYLGSYAALQGWDAIYSHEGESLYPSAWYNNEIPPVNTFEFPQDPISRASETVMALTWLRRDVKEATHSVQLTLSDRNLFPKNTLSAIGDDYAKLSMLTRVGIVYPEVTSFGGVTKIKADIELTPTEFSNLGVRDWYVTASSQDGSLFPSLLQKLKESQILPESNKTDYSKRVYQSETGEILLNGKEQSLKVVSSRLEGAIMKQNQPVELQSVAISSCSVPAAITVASLEKGKSIEQSKRLLVIVATNALNQGQVFENSSMSLMVDIGGYPVLMQTAQVSISIKTNQKGTPVIHALNLDGTPAEEVECSLVGQKLMVALDTGKLKYATPFFEIIYQ